MNDSGRPIAEVARDIGVDEGTSGNWVNLCRSGHAGEEPPLGISERAELAQSRRDVAMLRMERELWQSCNAGGFQRSSQRLPTTRPISRRLRSSGRESGRRVDPHSTR